MVCTDHSLLDPYFNPEMHDLVFRFCLIFKFGINKSKNKHRTLNSKCSSTHLWVKMAAK